MVPTILSRHARGSTQSTLTRRDRFRLCTAFALRLTADICLALGKRLYLKSYVLAFLGHGFDRIGCYAYEAAYRRVDSILDKAVRQ